MNKRIDLDKDEERLLEIIFQRLESTAEWNGAAHLFTDKYILVYDTTGRFFGSKKER